MIFLLLSAILLLAACSNGSTQTGMSDLNHTIIQATDEIQITISHVTYELLAYYGGFILFSHNGGTDEIAFIPNIPVKNFRYIKINGEEIMFIVEEDLIALDILLPSTPLVVDWTATGSMAYGGFAFDDENGTTRYFAFNYDAEGLTAFRWMEFDGRFSVFDESQETFILRNDNGIAHLEEFVDRPGWFPEPRVTVAQLTPEIELIAVWVMELYSDGRPVNTGDALIVRNNFLKNFESYTEFDNPNRYIDSWLILSGTTDLREFQFFSLGQVCDPWVNDEWHPFYVHETLGQQEILPFGQPVAVPWMVTGTWPGFGIGFLDEDGKRWYFTLNSNEGSGFPPMFIHEFEDRVYCPDCANDTRTALLEEEVDNTNSSNDTAIHSTDNIQVIVDGTEVTFDEQHPMIVDGHIMIPIRNVFEQLGADVELHEFGIGHQVIIRSPFAEAFIIGQEDMYIGSVPYTAVAPPQIINDAIKLSVDTLVEIFIRNGHYAAWDLESPTLNIFNNASATNALRIMNEAADNIRARGINAVVLQDGNVVDSYMLFARPGLGFSIFYITIDDEEFMAVNSELDGDQAADGIFVPGRTRTQFVTWRNERGPGSPIFAWTFIQIFDDEEALLRERFPN